MHASTPLRTAIALALLIPATAFALNDISQPPTESTYWHQGVVGLDIPSVVGGLEPGDRLGAAVASGDFNGDGFDDLAMGAPGEDTDFGPVQPQEAGAIVVVYGGFDGLVTAGSGTLFGGLEGAQLGDALAAGDIDGDGYDDLVVGMSHYDDGSLVNVGQIAIAFGSPVGLDFLTVFIDQDSPEINNNSEAYDRFGASVATGDVNGDGFADVAIGTPGESFASSGLNSGAVYLLYGGDDGLQGANAPRAYQVFVESDANLPYASEAGNQYGYSVLLNDMNDDGFDELSVGAPFSDVQDTDAGLVYSHWSVATMINTLNSVVHKPDSFESGSFANHFFFGAALSGTEAHAPGELARLMIGAPGFNEGVELETFIGRGYVYAPAAIKSQHFIVEQEAPEAPQPGDEFGYAVLFADLNDDGNADEYIIGVPGQDGDSGVLQLLDPHPGSSPFALRQGDPGVVGVAEVGDHFGQVLARGNFNGRGGDELVIGVPNEGIGSVGDAGAVFVLSWDPGDLIFADGFEGSGP